MAVFFISDLHLCPSRPEINRAFLDFLRGPARAGRLALHPRGPVRVLGGDDDIGDPFNASVVAALADLSDAERPCASCTGTGISFSARRSLRACRGALLRRPVCLDPSASDVSRCSCTETPCAPTTTTTRLSAPRFDRRPGRLAFLAQPLARRKEQIEALRRASESEKQRKAPEIMDVNRGAVEAALRDNGYPRLIHGHTHRPARHEHLVDGKLCERWVLADWYLSGAYLRCDAATAAVRCNFHRYPDRPRSRSARMSRTDSSPTEIRTSPSVIPARARASFEIATVRGRGRMSDGGLGVAEIGRDRYQPGRVDHAPGGLSPAFDFEGNHGAARTLLLHRQGMLRVRGQPRIVDPCDCGNVLPASARAHARCATGPPCGSRSVSSTLEQDPGVESGQGRSRCPQKTVDPSMTSSRFPRTAPPSTLPWPSRYLVAE